MVDKFSDSPTKIFLCLIPIVWDRAASQYSSNDLKPAARRWTTKKIVAGSSSSTCGRNGNLTLVFEVYAVHERQLISQLF